MSTVRTTTLAKADGSASVPVDTVINGTAKAWVNFNGTGTVAIRAAFNVSSITDLGVGAYRVNFTADMPDTNFCGVANAVNEGVNYAIANFPESRTTSKADIETFSTTAITTNADQNTICAAVFR